MNEMITQTFKQQYILFLLLWFTIWAWTKDLFYNNANNNNIP